MYVCMNVQRVNRGVARDQGVQGGTSQENHINAAPKQRTVGKNKIMSNFCSVSILLS